MQAIGSLSDFIVPILISPASGVNSLTGPARRILFEEFGQTFLDLLFLLLRIVAHRSSNGIFSEPDRSFPMWRHAFNLSDSPTFYFSVTKIPHACNRFREMKMGMTILGARTIGNSKIKLNPGSLIQ